MIPQPPWASTEREGALNLYLGIYSPLLAAHDQEKKPKDQLNTPLLAAGSFI
jgi:hypothetical protein